MRRWRAMRNCVMHMFQSTHPHGVRLVLYGPATGIAWRFNPRTLTGCDGQNESQSKTSHCFNPRTLTGCDVAIKAGDNVIWNVSIHAPSRGATRVLVEKAHWEYVSIHAPSRGATIITPFLTISIPRFNPRTLTGCDSKRAFLQSLLLVPMGIYSHRYGLFLLNLGISSNFLYFA